MKFWSKGELFKKYKKNGKISDEVLIEFFDKKKLMKSIKNKWKTMHIIIQIVHIVQKICLKSQGVQP